MNALNYNEIVGMIKSDFGSLWHCSNLGKTMEIVTPYLYPDNSFVSIFITKRSDRVIVSDGGHLTEFFETASDDEAFLTAVLSKFREHHGVSEFPQKGKTFYFKQTKDIKLIPSIAFDLCNFVIAASTAATLSITEDESLDRSSFRTRADKFIKVQIPKGTGTTITLNRSLPEVKEATFSAVISRSNKLWIVIYLTGSNLKYFQLSVSNAIVNTQFARQSSLKSHIVATVPLINNEAVGYQPTKLSHRFEMLKDVAKTPPILWSHKEELNSILPLVA